MAPKPIVIKITGDADSLEKEIAKARAQLDKLETSVDKSSDSQKRFGSAVDDVRGRLSNLASEFTGRLGPAGEVAQSKIDGILTTLSKVSPVAIGAAAGVAVAAAGFAKLAQVSVDYFVDLGEQTRKFQAATGATAEFGSVFVDMANDLGVGSETATSAMARLAKQAGTNEEKLNEFGVTVVRTADGNVDMAATLGSVADAFVRTTDPAERAALGTFAFGKSWREMVPLLAGGSQGLADAAEEAEKLGRVMSQDNVDAAFELQQSMVDLNDSFDGMKLQIGGAIVPLLADAAQGATWLNEKIDGLTQGFLDFGTAAEAAITGIPFVGPALQGLAALGDIVKDTGDKTKEAAAASTEFSDATAEQTDAQAEAQAATEANEQAVADYEQRLIAGKKAQDDFTNAVLGSASASLNLEQQQLNTSTSLEDYRVKSEAAKVATDQYGVGSGEATKANQALSQQTIDTKEQILRAAGAAVEAAANNAEMGGSSLDAGGKALVQRDYLVELAGTLTPGSPLRVWLDAYIGQLNNVPAAKNTTVRTTYETVYTTYGSPNHGFDIAAETGHAYAKGGPLKAGVPALVGEEGPEIIVPTANGFVHTASETKSMLSEGGTALGGGGVVINISGVVGDKDAVIGWVHEGLRQYDSARRTS
jgi:hypothetical protein